MSNLGFHIPSVPGVDIKIFSIPAASNDQWIPWIKPNGFGILTIICIGGGTGGGGGFSRASGNGGGGGGGSSGGTGKICIPLSLLPDVLYVRTGSGGLGVSSGSSGGAQLSFVSISPTTTSSDVLCASSSSFPGTATSGTLTVAGNGGSACAAPTVGFMPLGVALGFGFQASPGQAGTNGGAITGGNGVDIAFPTTGTLCMGGTGGGGTSNSDFSGGGIISTTSKLSEMAPEASPPGSFDGAGTYRIFSPFWSFSALGGGSSNLSTGGRGGTGLWGSGGGGGGAGTVGGRGGDGGDGIVFMICS